MIRALFLVLALFELALAEAATGVPVRVIPSAINLSIAASPTSGYAPLGVFFSSVGTTSPVTSYPFHEMQCTWNFGDSGAGTWSQGAVAGASKNTAIGTIAAHVYETPGTYSVTSSCTDGTTTVSGPTLTITVNDPDGIGSPFAGTQTECIANVQATAGAGGCPAGAATPAGTSDFDAALAACLGSNKRCLFKRGDTFTNSANGAIGNISRVIIGAYGSGDAPLVNSSTSSPFNSSAATPTDIRIMDIKIVGPGTPSAGGNCFNSNIDTRNVTILRMDCSALGGGVIYGGAPQGGVGHFTFVQDSSFYDYTSSNAFFGRLRNSAWLGNLSGPVGSGSEHNTRFQQGNQLVVSHNTNTTPAVNKTVMLVRSSEHFDGPNQDTQYVYLSYNKIIAGALSAQLFQIAPSGNTQNNWVTDVIADSNWIVYGASSNFGFVTESVRTTIRNNILDGSASLISHTGIAIDHQNTAGAPAPDLNWIYNNTFYSSATVAIARAVLVGSLSPAGIVNTTIKNNLGYFPNATTVALYLDGVGASGTVAAGNTCNTSACTTDMKTDPNFTTTPPTTPAHFAPTAGSYAIGGGVSVPVWSRFDGAAQPASRNIGAW